MGATWKDIFEDYIEHIVLQKETEASLLPFREAEAELENWTHEIEENPGEWETWRKAQEKNIQDFKEKILGEK
jgi:hypothetical protein